MPPLGAAGSAFGFVLLFGDSLLGFYLFCRGFGRLGSVENILDGTLGSLFRLGHGFVASAASCFFVFPNASHLPVISLI